MTHRNVFKLDSSFKTVVFIANDYREDEKDDLETLGVSLNFTGI